MKFAIDSNFKTASGADRPKADRCASAPVTAVEWIAAYGVYDCTTGAGFCVASM